MKGVEHSQKVKNTTTCHYDVTTKCEDVIMIAKSVMVLVKSLEGET